MAKIFIDTNILIDLVEKRRPGINEHLDGHHLFLSPLSFHILLYVTKHKLPYPKLYNIVANFHLVPFDHNIAFRSLDVPTRDFEDNVQLLSASTSDCDIFLTYDKKLLSLKFFGKLKIMSQISS